MEIKRSGSQPSAKGPVEFFTGAVRIDPRPGDVVWCPPGKKHWHGATATTAMSHMALVEKLDGSGVDWLEKVTEEQYLSNE